VNDYGFLLIQLLLFVYVLCDLHILQVDVPDVCQGQVLVKVKACSLSLVKQKVFFWHVVFNFS